MWGDVILLRLNFSFYYCSIDLKRQSEHSGLRPDTSSLVLFIAKFSKNGFRIAARILLKTEQSIQRCGKSLNSVETNQEDENIDPQTQKCSIH